MNLERVDKSYGVRMLLDAVSLGIAAGERIGIVGVNGAGKTSLLRVLVGEDPPDVGRVVHGRTVRSHTSRRVSASSTRTRS